MIIKKVIMKEKATRREFLQLSEWLENRGNLLSNAERTDDGRFVAIICFDDESDYTAFRAEVSQ